MPVKPSGKIQFEQHEIDGRRRKPGMPDDVVDLDRRRPERIDDPRAIGLVRAAAPSASRLVVRLLGLRWRERDRCG